MPELVSPFRVSASQEADALQKRVAVEKEWLKLTIASWSKWHHYRLTTPDWELVADRRGLEAGKNAETVAKRKDPLLTASPMSNPETVPSMAHAMEDDEHWSVVFAHPLPQDAPSWQQEPLSLRFEARRCPDVGCTKGLGKMVTNWTNPVLWSERFGGQARHHGGQSS